MSTDTDFDVTHKATSLRKNLLGFDGIETVTEPRIRNSESGQYVSFGVTFTDDVEHPDVKFNNELTTYLDMYFGSSEDWWLTNDIPGCYGVVNTYGLNPNPDTNIGAHTQ